MIKKIYNMSLMLLFIAFISSCASTQVSNSIPLESDTYSENEKHEINHNAASIKKYDNTMLWEITGKDKNGIASTILVLGTIHVGDDRLYPVPSVIESAYENADRVVGELSTASWEVMSKETNKKKNESAKKEAVRIAETGKVLSDYLTEEEKNYLLKYVKSEDVINKFEPWFLASELSEVPIQLSGLESTKSYDIYFIEKSLRNKKEIEGLDSIETQLSDLSYGDWNTQLAMLKDSINDLIKDSDSAGKHILKVYETYLSADESALSKIINSNIKDDDAVYSEDYYNTIFVEKNKKWAEKLENYLLEGGTTFVFAGCGHFVGDDSVFSYMKKDGILDY